MGSSGRIKITKISSIKTDWAEIRERLIMYFESDLKTADKWEVSDIEDALNNSIALPLNIDELSNEEICNLFNYLRSCDCPYLFEDCIITAYGDYVDNNMNTLSVALKGEYIETWT